MLFREDKTNAHCHKEASMNMKTMPFSIVYQGLLVALTVRGSVGRPVEGDEFDRVSGRLLGLAFNKVRWVRQPKAPKPQALKFKALSSEPLHPKTQSPLALFDA